VTAEPVSLKALIAHHSTGIAVSLKPNNDDEHLIDIRVRISTTFTSRYQVSDINRDLMNQLQQGALSLYVVYSDGHIDDLSTIDRSQFAINAWSQDEHYIGLHPYTDELSHPRLPIQLIALDGGALINVELRNVDHCQDPEHTVLLATDLFVDAVFSRTITNASSKLLISTKSCHRCSTNNCFNNDRCICSHVVDIDISTDSSRL
jgi:hypothetical protein